MFAAGQIDCRSVVNVAKLARDTWHSNSKELALADKARS